MRKLLFFCGLISISACSGGVAPIDSKAFLNSLDGPKVPTVQDTMLESAKNAEKQGDFKGAAQIYQQVLEKKPDDKDIMFSLADSYRRSGDLDHAIALYDLILQKDASMLAAKEGKGLALIAKGDFETSGPILEEVLKAEPTRWKTLNAIGILFTTRGLHKEAQQYFNAALKQNPVNASVLNNLGLSQALNKDTDGAIATLTQASAITAVDSVDRKRVDLNLSLVYAVAGKLDEARGVAERYYSGPVLNNNMGLYAHLAQDDELAKTYLNMALTDSKMFYERAWDNLQTISGSSPNEQKKTTADAPVVNGEQKPVEAPAAETPKEKEQHKAKEKEKPKAAKVKTDTVKNLADQAPKAAPAAPAPAPAPVAATPAPAATTPSEPVTELDQMIADDKDKKQQ